MFRTLDEKLNGFLFVIILPILLFVMSYYGFESSYTRFKTSERPPDFLFSSVYSYRIIPNYLSIHITDFMEYMINHHLSSIKDLLSRNGTPFYHGLFLTNGFFLILCSLLLDIILRYKAIDLLININIRRMIHLLLIFFIVITQYTPSNCDTIALCCYLTGVLLTLKYFHSEKMIFFYTLILLIALSTLVRETACLNIAFFASVFFSVKEFKQRNYNFILKIIPLIIAFLLPYLSLRVILDREQTSFVEGFYIGKNFSSPFNLAGLLFAAIVLYYMYRLCNRAKNQVVFRKYLFFSLPYLGMITLVGLFWEVRLFLPLIITGALVACHDFKKLYN
ncbi:hypothetical protein K0U91_08000 [Chryseobacterium chendengshani]|uniref:hypothetical protein n=1 Tax=Chryseobacterium sp. LJ668 TaxID=2864040 RepID=UPI001C68DEBD|nr:hypothetical protein [Chryseobacterium sp. LJ668]MBW8522414.1 hypothetical protein [Chryseobacterium sp. LJ668]QYK18053.1 hypothetical protein K0U91_08000 [Chryseobacterium sp. LJ668]